VLDITCGRAGCWVPPGEPARYSATISFTSNFLHGCREGSILIKAFRQPGGTSIYSSRGEVYDHSGTLLAVGVGAYKYRVKSSPNNSSPNSGLTI